MKQVCEGENPLCQLNIGAKKDVNPQPGVSKMHIDPCVFTPFSAVCSILNNWYMLRFFFAFYCIFYTHNPDQDLLCAVKLSLLHKAPKAYYKYDTEL